MSANYQILIKVATVSKYQVPNSPVTKSESIYKSLWLNIDTAIQSATHTLIYATLLLPQYLLCLTIYSRTLQRFQSLKKPMQYFLSYFLQTKTSIPWF